LNSAGDDGAGLYNSTSSTLAPSAGDDGLYPSTSPNVVSVGGTRLTVDNDAYGSETGWSFAAPTNIVKNGGHSYSQTGSWASQSGGFSGTYSTAAGGSSCSAVWTIPVTATNTGHDNGTEVSATWTASVSNATDATYTIYDGSRASGTVLGTVVIDQTKAPVGTVVGSFQFQELGVFYAHLTSGNGTLTMVLNADSANGTVVADAIGSAPGSASTGGPSQIELEPSYQLPFQSTGFRTTPDVSFDAVGGVTCYQNGTLTYGNGGTSLSSPCFAGLIAIVNQGRVADGGTTLNSTANPTQTLQALYSLPAADFHDITAGYNGFSAQAGYDYVTGRGSPIANLLVPDLVSYAMPNRLVVSTQPPARVIVGRRFELRVTVEDPDGRIIGCNGNVTIALAENPGGGTLGGTLTATAVDGVASFSGLTVNAPGTGYEIEATANGLVTATTRAFNVRRRR
jgi:hypothetical protein